MTIQQIYDHLAVSAYNNAVDDVVRTIERSINDDIARPHIEDEHDAMFGIDTAVRAARACDRLLLVSQLRDLKK